MKNQVNSAVLKLLFAVAGSCLTPIITMAQEVAVTNSSALTELSLEDLMEVKVTSVSRRDESAGEVPAALFVLTNEDIRRSGAQSLPEVLRLVPGLQVQQIDTNRWAVTARGSNSLFANKLLVLIDGRSVYTPLFSGVYWDAQDVRFGDVDRIEVIRGPGASVWGANAVNGVINVITKTAQDTIGGVVSGGTGSEEQGFGDIRYGAKISETSAARIYGKYFNRDNSAPISGVNAYDQWEAGQGGARFDYREGSDSLTIQGDIYKGNNGLRATVPSQTSFIPATIQETTNYDGNNIAAHWTSGFQGGQRLDIQAYYDTTSRSDLLHGERYETRDIDAQHFIPLTKHNDLMIGLNYRHIGDYLEPKEQIEFDNTSRTTEVYSSFLQNESRLFDDKLRLTLGSKFETNSYTGFEVQPNARIAWVPSPQETIWAAYSHAVRTPSRVERDGKVLIATVPGEGGIPTSAYVVGNSDFEAEDLNAYEIGYRVAPWSNYSLDIATFYNDYSNGLSNAMATPTFSDGRIEVPYPFANDRDSRTYGFEIVNTWKPLNNWTLQGWYSWSNTDADSIPNNVNPSDPAGSDPKNQAFLRSLLTLPGNINLDSYLRYVDSVPNYDIDAYLELTVRVAWQYTPSIELAVVGANLLHDSHQEYAADSINVAQAEIQRSVLGAITVKF